MFTVVNRYSRARAIIDRTISNNRRKSLAARGSQTVSAR